MAAALLNNDFKTFSNYTYPKILEEAGGKGKYIQELQSGAEMQKERGDKIHNITVSNPSKTVACNGELQCVLKQEITMSFSGGNPFTFASNLIGISTDNGNTWVFLNASDISVMELKKVFPNICDSIPLIKID